MFTGSTDIAVSRMKKVGRGGAAAPESTAIRRISRNLDRAASRAANRARGDVEVFCARPRGYKGCRREYPLLPMEPEVLILGLVLLLVGWLTGIGILTTIGIILLVVGAVLMLLGSVNRPVLGRRYWY